MRLLRLLRETARYDPARRLRDPRAVAAIIADFLLTGEHLGNVNSAVYPTDAVLDDFEEWLASEQRVSDPDYSEGRTKELLRMWTEQRFVKNNLQNARETLEAISRDIKGDHITLFRRSRLDPEDVRITIGGAPGADRYPMSSLRGHPDEAIELGRFWTYDPTYAQEYHHTGAPRHYRPVTFTALFAAHDVDVNATIATALIWNEHEVRLRNNGFDIPCQLVAVDIAGEPLDTRYARDKTYVTAISF